MAFTHCGIHCPQPLTPKQRSSTPYPTGPSCAACSQQQGADTAHSWPLPLTNPRLKPRDCHSWGTAGQAGMHGDIAQYNVQEKGAEGVPAQRGRVAGTHPCNTQTHKGSKEKLPCGCLDKECGEAAKQQSQMGCSAAHPQQLPAVPAAYLVPTFRAVPAPTPALIPEKAPKSHGITKGLYAC